MGEAPGGAHVRAESRTCIIFRQILCVLGEVAGLGQCEGKGNRMSQGLVGYLVGYKGFGFVKVRETRVGSRGLGQVIVGVCERNNMEVGHYAVSQNFPRSVL